MVQALKNPYSDNNWLRADHRDNWLARFDRRGPGPLPVISSGSSAIDRLLPEGGLRRGSLVEWLGDGLGSGVSLFPLMTICNLQEQGGKVVVVDRQQRFYPPAAAAAGIDLARTIVVRPTTEPDELWAIEQALRCGEVAAVLAWPDRLDSFVFHRLQLAVEEHGSLGLLVRPAGALRQPRCAEVRLLVSPRTGSLTWRWNVQLLRAGGHFAQGQVDVELQPHDDSSHVSASCPAPIYRTVVSSMATSATCGQTA